MKIVFCGDSSVGKSTIINRFSRNEFDETIQPTVTGVFHKEFIQTGNEPVNLEIWDTAGDERYGAVITSFFKNADVIIIVYDISNKSSFDHLDYWIKIVQDCVPKDTHIIIAGNKCDKTENREVSKEEGSQYSENIKALGFYEISALTSEGIIEMFSLAAYAPLNKVDKSIAIKDKDGDTNTCC